MCERQTKVAKLGTDPFPDLGLQAACLPCSKKSIEGRVFEAGLGRGRLFGAGKISF